MEIRLVLFERQCTLLSTQYTLMSIMGAQNACFLCFPREKPSLAAAYLYTNDGQRTSVLVCRTAWQSNALIIRRYHTVAFGIRDRRRPT